VWPAFRVVCKRDSIAILTADRLHAFRKTTAAVPERDKEIARRRWTNFKQRMNEIRCSVPSAVGKAPRRPA